MKCGQAHEVGYEGARWRVEVRDNGKLIAEMGLQLRYAPQWYHYFGGLADKVEGAVLPVDKPDTFTYTLNEDADVTVEVFNESGTTVRTITTKEFQTRGQHITTWDGRDNIGQVAPDGHKQRSANHAGMVGRLRPDGRSRRGRRVF